MNTIHYVSQEVAKMLEEKGYNKYGYTECTWSYDGNSKEWKLVYTADKRFQGHHLSFVYYAPTLLEAMDWLEERGIRMEIRMMHCKIKGDPYKIAPDDEYQWEWFFVICKGDDAERNILEDDEIVHVVTHIDRYECMNAAIKKGLEML